MKKLISILIIVVLCVSLFTACDEGVLLIGGTDGPTASTVPSASAASSKTDAPTAIKAVATATTSVQIKTPTSTAFASPSAAPTTQAKVKPTAAPTAAATSSSTPTASPAYTQAPAPYPSISLAQKSLHLTINGYPLDLPLAEDGAVFDTQTLNTEYPASLELLTSDAMTVTAGGQALFNGKKTEIEVPRIGHNEYIPITVSDPTDTRTVYIRTLHSGIPTLTSAGKSPNKGDYYISFPNQPLILKLDESGNVIYYNCAGAATDDIFGYWDFKKHVLPDGTVRYSYFEQNPAYNRLVSNGFAGGARVVLDEGYDEIDRIYMDDPGSARTDNVFNNPVEGHDFMLLDDGHYMLSSYELQLVHNIPAELSPNPQGSKVIAAHLREVKDGKTVLDWYSTDHPELYALSAAPYNDYANVQDQQPDYAHFNSMTIDPSDGNLICSFRHLSTIAKIDRKTGDIAWLLSGDADEFGLTEAQKTSNQHYVRLTADGYLTIFNNGNTDGRTSILKLKLDEKNKEVTEYNQFYVGDHFSEACGSAVNLKRNTFVIGWGLHTDGLGALTEIDFDTNQKLFELTLPEGIFTYRCAKYE